MSRITRASVIAIATLIGAASVRAETAPNAAEGKALFAKCSICHSPEPGVAKIGPSLADVVGRSSGTLAGYTYSPAMKAANLVWTPANLAKFLAAPAILVPGTKMAFPGLSSAMDRDNMVAYLKSISKPMPEPKQKAKPAAKRR